MTLTTTDFYDEHYVYWRNSEKPDLVFMELFYGPFLSALSVAIFFLICLEYKFTKQTSVILTIIFSFTTIVWAYSNTSLNVVPALFFILLGFLFYKKSQTNFELKFLLLSSACFGFSYLIRESTFLIFFPIFGLILIDVFRKKSKIIVNNYLEHLLQIVSLNIDKIIILPALGASILGHYLLGFQIFALLLVIFMSLKLLYVSPTL